MGLAAMMRLVIEEMHHQASLFPAHGLFRRAAVPGQVLGQPGLIDPVGEILDPGVRVFPLRVEFSEIMDQGRALWVRNGVRRPAVQARHPLPVAPQQMTQRAMQRLPEQTDIFAPLRVAEPRRPGINPAVHLGIVSRHDADVLRCDHDDRPPFDAYENPSLHRQPTLPKADAASASPSRAALAPPFDPVAANRVRTADRSGRAKRNTARETTRPAATFSPRIDFILSGTWRQRPRRETTPAIAAARGSRPCLESRPARQRAQPAEPRPDIVAADRSDA